MRLVVGGSSRREGIYVYMQLIHFLIQQKLSQSCKAIILQFFKKISVQGDKSEVRSVLKYFKNLSVSNHTISELERC